MRGDPELGALLAESAQDELWLVSYADLLTLLIGFFAVLVAAAPVHLARFEQIAAAISGAAPPPLAELKRKVDAFVAESELGDKVVAREDERGLAIEFKDALLFDTGSADIRAEGAEVVREIARLLVGLPQRPVVIEGHTDDVPIATARFPSNWELGAQRAINVLRALEAAGVPAGRMSARSFANTAPVRRAGTEQELRAASRRVVVRVE